MPDWISHVLIALVISELFNIKKKSLVVLGSLLPDFLGKVYLLNYFIKMPLWLTTTPFVFHLWVPPLLAALLVAFLFRGYMIAAFILVPLGAVLHLLADYTTIHFFNDGWYQFLWEDQYWMVLIVTFIVYITVLLIKNRKEKKKKESDKYGQKNID